MNEYHQPSPVTRIAGTFAHTDACIFVVDDNPDILRLVEIILRKEGFTQLELISDPREVLPRYQHAPPDLVLLDQTMPHLNGFNVMAAINPGLTAV